MSDFFSTHDDVPAAPADFDRRQLLARLAAVGIGGIAFQRALATSVSGQAKVTAEMIRSAQWIADIELTEAQQAEVAKELNKYLEGQQALLQYSLDADVSPAIAFVPHFFVESNAIGEAERKKMFRAEASSPESLPDGIDDPQLPFASIVQLAKGLRQKRWSSQQLTSLYLDRLAKYDPVLRCVVQRTEDLAMQQAKRADRELQEGRDRGPLHGIPWGAKDIIAVPPFRTTWGAKPYREKVRPNRATVYDRLQDAGAVLLGKLSVGTLAWGDIWHDGMTRNPWNVAEGSSGSSAGSCAATVAGLCGFAIGSETLGSIVSPTQRCRVTGLRPTFGRVSRYGCMTLSWTMDKVGPIGRTVEDCALIFAAIAGSDGRDPTVVDRPFLWQPPSPPSQGKWKIGYVEGQLSKQEETALEFLRGEGHEILKVAYPSDIPENALLDALSAEATSMHEDLFRSDATEEDFGKWGPTFREAQWIRAIHYIRGMRARTLLIQETEEVLKKVDAVLGSNDLVRTNLSGHPSLVVACGSQPNKVTDAPGTIKLTARFFGDQTLLQIGHRIQKALPPLPIVPPLDRWLQENQKDPK